MSGVVQQDSVLKLAHYVAMIAVSAQTIATVLRRDVPLIARLANYADDWGVAHRGAAVLQQLRAVRGIDALRMSEV